MRRPARALVALPVVGLVAVLSSAACAPFHAGAAATVGDHRISTQQLRQVIAREQAAATAYAQSSSAAPGQKATALAAEQRALAELIQIQLLQKAASTLHANVPANAAGRERQQIVASQSGATDLQVQQVGAYSGVDLDLFSQFKAYLDADTAAAAPSSAQVAAFATTPDHTVAQVERIDIPTRAVAQELVDQVRQQPGSFDSIVQSGGGSATTLVYTARELQAMDPGAPLTSGGVFGPVRVNDADYAVFSLTLVKSDDLSVSLDTGSLERQALAEEAFDRAYQQAVTQLGVHVSPRFGAWSFPTADGLGTIGGLPALDQLSTVAPKAAPAPAPSAGA